MDRICPRYALLMAAAPGRLLDELGGLEQHVRGDGEAEGLRGLEVDDELKFARLLDGQVSRVGAFEDAVYVIRRTAIERRPRGPVGHQSVAMHGGQLLQQRGEAEDGGE